MPVEDELVLRADRVAERDVAGVVARPRAEHLLAVAVLAHVEGRGGDVDEQLRARPRQVGRRPRLPQVLAHGEPGRNAADRVDNRLVPRLEVALLVEDAVVRKEPFVDDRLHLALGADIQGVEEPPLHDVRSAHHEHESVRSRGDLVERPGRCSQEPGPQEEILGRVAGSRQLREEGKVRAGLLHLLEPLEYECPVSVQVADHGVDLRQREPHQDKATSLRL